jgi:hypothetical protein
VTGKTCLTLIYVYTVPDPCSTELLLDFLLYESLHLSRQLGSNFFALVSKCITFSRLHQKVIDEDVNPQMNVPLLPLGGGPSTAVSFPPIWENNA